MKINLLPNRLMGKIGETIFKLSHHNGISVVEKEWDYLIILDACRYDYFKRVNDIGGELKKKISQGSVTREWFEKNFPNKYKDIIYVSGNGNPVRLSDNKFYHMEDVGSYAWSEELGVVPPKKVTKAALNLISKNKNKRFIIHYNQPHGPYIGKTSMKKPGEIFDEIPKRSYIAMMKEAGDKKLHKMYKENLEYVLNEVKKLLPYLEGKIVITADHGEMLGEKFCYGHRRGLYFKELVEIPWLEIKKEKSKKIKRFNNYKRKINKEVKERLRKMGYM